MKREVLLVLVLSTVVLAYIVAPLQGLTEGKARYNMRETWTLQDRMLVSHLELDKLILSSDGEQVVQINRYSFDGMAIPADDWQGSGIISPGYNGAIGYRFNSGEVLWVGAIVTDQNPAGTYKIELAVPGGANGKLLTNIPGIVAVGIKANDGTEHWAPATYTSNKIEGN